MKKIFLVAVIFAVKIFGMEKIYEKAFLPNDIGLNKNTKTEDFFYMKVDELKYNLQTIQKTKPNQLILNNIPIKFGYQKGVSFLNAGNLYDNYDGIDVFVPGNYFYTTFISFSENAYNDFFDKIQKETNAKNFDYFRTVSDAKNKGYGTLLFLEVLSISFLYNEKLTFKPVVDSMEFYKKFNAKQEINNSHWAINKKDLIDFFTNKEIIINNPHLLNVKQFLNKHKIPYNNFYGKNMLKQMQKQGWFPKYIVDKQNENLIKQNINFPQYCAINNLRGADFSKFGNYDFKASKRL